MVILPMEELTKDDTKFQISMKADPGSKIYHSKDTKSWQEVKDVYMDEKLVWHLLMRLKVMTIHFFYVFQSFLPFIG